MGALASNCMRQVTRRSVWAPNCSLCKIPFRQVAVNMDASATPTDTADVCVCIERYRYMSVIVHASFPVAQRCYLSCSFVQAISVNHSTKASDCSLPDSSLSLRQIPSYSSIASAKSKQHLFGISKDIKMININVFDQQMYEASRSVYERISLHVG